MSSKFFESVALPTITIVPFAIICYIVPFQIPVSNFAFEAFDTKAYPMLTLTNKNSKVKEKKNFKVSESNRSTKIDSDQVKGFLSGFAYSSFYI